MKILFISFSLIFSFFLDNPQEKIISDLNLTKEEIYSKSLLWIAETWENPDEVIKFKDKELGKIIVRGGLSSKPIVWGVAQNGTTNAEITILLRDNKAKITIADPFHEYLDGTIWTIKEEPAMSKKVHAKWVENVKQEIKQLLIDFEKTLTKTESF